MKQTYIFNRWIITIAISLISNFQLVAFEHNGIFYRHLGPNELEVISATDDYKTYPDTPISNNYNGDIFIPGTITIETSYGATITYYVTQIGDNAFCNCTLETVTIGEGIETIKFKAFYQTTATEIILPSSLKEIEYYAFMYAHIDELNIPYGVTTIGSGAFSYSDIRKLNIPGSVETINEQITNGCSKLEYLIFEDSYNTINGTNHGYIGDLPSELLYIGRNFWDTCHGFNNDRAVRQIEFGKHFSHLPIHSEFLSRITSAKKIIVRNTTPPEIRHSDQWESAYFNTLIYQNTPLYIPEGTIFEFKTADVWKNFQQMHMFDPSDPTIGITKIQSSKIIAKGKNIIINGNIPGVVVYTLDGQVIFRGISNCIAVPSAGLFIVRVGNYTTKILIK